MHRGGLQQVNATAADVTATAAVARGVPAPGTVCNEEMRVCRDGGGSLRWWWGGGGSSCLQTMLEESQIRRRTKGATHKMLGDG